MGYEIEREIYNSLDFNLDAAIFEYKLAKARHRKTVGVPAPTAHPLVEMLVDVYDGEYTVQPEPPPPPPVEDLPIRVSAVAALLVLDRVGLYNTVHTALSNHPLNAVRVWYERTAYWEENHPYIQLFGPEFGLTDAQIKNLFIQALDIDNGMT